VEVAAQNALAKTGAMSGASFRPECKKRPPDVMGQRLGPANSKQAELVWRLANETVYIVN